MKTFSRTYSPGKDDVFTDPDYGRQELRKRPSPPLQPSTQDKQEDRQISHVSGNERVNEQDPRQENGFQENY